MISAQGPFLTALLRSHMTRFVFTVVLLLLACAGYAMIWVSTGEPVVGIMAGMFGILIILSVVNWLLNYLGFARDS